MSISSASTRSGAGSVMRCTKTSVAAEWIECRTRNAAASGSIVRADHAAALAEREQIAHALDRDLVDPVQARAHVAVALRELEQHQEEAALAPQPLVARAQVVAERGARVVAEEALDVVLAAPLRELAVAPVVDQREQQRALVGEVVVERARRRRPRAPRRRPCRSARSRVARTAPRPPAGACGASRSRAPAGARLRSGTTASRIERGHGAAVYARDKTERKL